MMGKETMRRASESGFWRRTLTFAHFLLAFALIWGLTSIVVSAETLPVDGASAPSPNLSSAAIGAQGQNVPASDTEHPAHLEFTWIDGYELPVSCQLEAAREVRRLFMMAGIEIDWELPGVDDDRHKSPDVQVILVDSEPEAWGLDPDVLASALNEPGGDPNPHAVFIFMPNVLDAMTGSADPSALQDAVGLGTVLGRLVAETTVQAAHITDGSSGLVSLVVSRDHLLDPECCLDYAATRDLWFTLLMQ
jgi:hypothetical protein